MILMLGFQNSAAHTHDSVTACLFVEQIASDVSRHRVVIFTVFAFFNQVENILPYFDNISV